MMKDPTRFFSIRSDTYGERLSTLNYESSCVNKCTWENYNEYLDDLREIQQYLSEQLNENITLVDAESFMWMVYKLFDMYGRRKPFKAYKKPALSEPLETEVTGCEGGRNGFYVTRYERNPKLRKLAAQAGNYTCVGCGMKFEDVYGSLGADFIEIHHTVPLSTYDEEHETPLSELVCVCSNCHSMIHRKKNYVLSIPELKAVLQREKH